MANGLDKSKRLSEKRDKQADKAAEVPPLNPVFPWRAIPFPFAFFTLGANPEKKTK
jgi:hypothetical protein